MQMLGVIKNLIIIHLGSMRERIRPNRWINSERRDERLEGESVGHHLSASASRSGLYFAEKLQEAQGFPASLSELKEHGGFCLSGRVCFLRLG